VTAPIGDRGCGMALPGARCGASRFDFASCRRRQIGVLGYPRTGISVSYVVEPAGHGQGSPRSFRGGFREALAAHLTGVQPLVTLAFRRCHPARQSRPSRWHLGAECCLAYGPLATLNIKDFAGHDGFALVRA
jgi:hypothetical protein